MEFWLDFLFRWLNTQIILLRCDTRLFVLKFVTQMCVLWWYQSLTITTLWQLNVTLGHLPGNLKMKKNTVQWYCVKEPLATFYWDSLIANAPYKIVLFLILTKFQNKKKFLFFYFNFFPKLEILIFHQKCLRWMLHSHVNGHLIVQLFFIFIDIVWVNIAYLLYWQASAESVDKPTISRARSSVAFAT